MMWLSYRSVWLVSIYYILKNCTVVTTPQVEAINNATYHMTGVIIYR
jgi:hypothetical protein